jgi:AcrR family transcriptional regulator
MFHLSRRVVAERRVRADAQRNLDAVVSAAREVFATAGVDAPVRAIAASAGVGVGTVYRHFPQRSDLVIAVFKQAVDSCAAAAPELAASLPPREALAAWLHRYTEFVATKRGLAAALHSGDPAFAALPAYFQAELGPALTSLYDAAVAAGEARPGVDALEVLGAVANLAHGGSPAMVELLVEGLLTPRA